MNQATKLTTAMNVFANFRPSTYVRVHKGQKSGAEKVYLRICSESVFYKALSGHSPFAEVCVENYAQAQTKLVSLMGKNAVPDLIILDTPFATRALQDFTGWLQLQPQLSSIPVLYNKGRLLPWQCKQLRESRLVDDIIDLENEHHLLVSKSLFLQQVKSYQKAKRATSFSPQRINKSLSNQTGLLLRRMVDILLSFSFLVLLLPVFVLIGLLIKLESKGPIIYISYRAGKGYKIFKFFKFRTMQAGADQQRANLDTLNLYDQKPNSAHFFKVKNDPRITRFGAFLRNTSLDELPQLINVLIGDMSIVGNRPLPLYEAATLTTNEWAERFMAPAGITGLWQITKRGKAEMSAEERIHLDIHYAKSNGFFKDLWIIIKTPTALFQKTDM